MMEKKNRDPLVAYKPSRGGRPGLRSISRRLATALISVTVLVSVITIAVIYFNAVRNQEIDLKNKADEYKDYLIGALERPLWTFADPTIEAICRTFLQNDLVVRLETRDASGRVVFSSEKGSDSDVLKRAGKIYYHDELMGEIQVAITRRYAKEEGRKLLLNFVSLMLIVSILFVSLTYFFVLVFLKKPLDSLNQVVGPYTVGRYDEPIPESSYTEFQTFRKTLIQMGETIRAQMNELKTHRDHLEEMVRHRTMELVAAKEQAEKANRAKSVFLANMSHELRTPLNAVLGFSQMMKNASDVTSEQRKYLDIILSSGQHLLNLINNVLDISKIESGRVELEASQLDLFQLIKEISFIMSMQAYEKGLAFTVEQPPELPRYIRADAGKLRQVLINLIGNAIKHTPQGIVTFRMTAAETEKSDRLRLRFEIEDTGPGIRKEDRQRIFSSFVQLEDQRPSEAGTGLGLAICKQYVELMGGRISVAGEPGKGSIFHFEIVFTVVSPVEICPQPQNSRIVGLAPGQPRYRLLIAEDRPENRSLLCEMLEPLGFDLREAANGQEAVEVFEQWRPHMIWMDIRMPVMDGLQATRHIKAIGAGAQTKVIAVTAHALEEERREILAAGCDGFIRKPYRYADIIAALARHLGVRFVYEEASTPADEGLTLNAAALADLPGRLLGELEDAVIRIDSEAVHQAIKAIGIDHPSVALVLETAARDLQFGRILRMIRASGAETIPGKRHE